MDYIKKKLNLAWRQQKALDDAVDMFKKLISGRIPLKKLSVTMLAILECLLCVTSDTPRTPAGEELDLTGYELVFADEFDGDTLDTDVWRYRNMGTYNKGFYDPSMVRVEDGNLIITGKYLNEGTYGEGWYACGIAIKENFCRGYYEIRAILNPNQSNTRDFWSSFWLSCDGVYDEEISKGGPGGCEIDIMESHSGSYNSEKYRKCVTHAVWCNGYDDNPDKVDGRNMGSFYADEPFTQYNTYGLMWTDTEYIWYINGVETVRSSFPNGVSEVPEEVILSLSIPIYDFTKSKDDVSEFKVDYIHIYQLAD